MKLDILAFAAHPDDIELACCGTLLKHIEMGKKVGIIDMTKGELGTRGTAAIREKEAMVAAKMMGVVARENLDLGDGFFEHSKENTLTIIKKIRKYQPEIILANALHDRHPDHGRAAKLVAEACFYSGLQKIETKEGNVNQEKWRPKAVYHYIQDRNLKPDFVVDITEFIDRKMEVILAFRSQFYLPDAKEFEEELQTPISGKQFFDFLKAKAATYGRPAGLDYAEGYNVSRIPGVDDLFSLI